MARSKAARKPKATPQNKAAPKTRKAGGKKNEKELSPPGADKAPTSDATTVIHSDSSYVPPPAPTSAFPLDPALPGVGDSEPDFGSEFGSDTSKVVAEPSESGWKPDVYGQVALAMGAPRKGTASKTATNVKSWMSREKLKYKEYAALRAKSGWSWNSTLFHPMVHDDIWDEFVALNKQQKGNRLPFPQFAVLELMYQGKVFTGKGAKHDAKDIKPLASDSTVSKFGIGSATPTPAPNRPDDDRDRTGIYARARPSAAGAGMDIGAAIRLLAGGSPERRRSTIALLEKDNEDQEDPEAMCEDDVDAAVMLFTTDKAVLQTYGSLNSLNRRRRFLNSALANARLGTSSW
ncbi:hypothetical protein P7C70_g5359, partial [Phenoliferia sp. Uapishka_3]